MKRYTGWLAALTLPLLAACAGEGGGGGGGGNTNVSITLSDSGCTPSQVTVPAGRVTFSLSNPRSSSVTSFDIVQGGRSLLNVTNVIGGLSRNASVDLEEGEYTMRCMKGGLGGPGTLIVTD